MADRMIIEFRNDENDPVRTVTLSRPLTNLAIGQIIVFDHPQLAKTLHANITQISHVVYLDRGEPPVTYVDANLVPRH